MSTHLMDKPIMQKSVPAVILKEKTVATILRYASLSFSGAFLGTYSILLCNHIFANAQTNNIISLLLAVKQGNFFDVLWRLLALILFMIGISLTVSLPKALQKRKLNWESVCLSIEFFCICLVGFMPASLPPFLLIAPLFLASALQYNTFKDCLGVNVSTLFCTNNVRQFVISFWDYRATKNKESLLKLTIYGIMILSFLLGAVACFFAVDAFAKSSIFLTAILLFLNYMEHSMHEAKPL